ncbi:hypothetical protein [Chimaeribacter arupi]|uniref:hypothetical protein n=1 Tax=Chimaeribacter arupi TaxID=2060066 RepID=UPI0029468EAB|nr:hypothetical protein [Chimaeribacter arupi]MDV5140928.1 hypothetical protein [Chimaeribacter arupi]
MALPIYLWLESYLSGVGKERINMKRRRVVPDRVINLCGRCSLFKREIILFCTLLFSGVVSATGPDCSDINSWPTQITANLLAKFGIKSESIIFEKTKTDLLVSGKITKKEAEGLIKREVERAGRIGLSNAPHLFDDIYLSQPIYKQIYRIQFTGKNNQLFRFMTTTLASDEECSISVEAIARVDDELLWPL